MTIKEIARICGVSRGTVDRVLNNRGKVKPETEALILKTIAEHGYTKNIVGRALTVKKTSPVIGVILCSEGNPFFDDVIAGFHAAQAELHDYGASVMLKTMCGHEVDQQLALIDELEAHIAALVIQPINSRRIAARLRALKDGGMPIVTVNTDIDPASRCCYVGSNYESGGAVAAGMMALVTAGQAKVGIIAGVPTLMGHVLRQKGFEDHLLAISPALSIISRAPALDDQEGCHSNLLILCGEAVAELTYLDGDTGINVHLKSLVDGLLCVAYSQGSLLADGLCQRNGSLHQLLGLHNGIHQTNLQGLVSLHIAAAVDQLLGDSRRNQASEPLCSTEAGGDSQSHLRLSEESLGGGDADVAGHGQLAATAQCKAVDGCNDGTAELLDAGEHGVTNTCEFSGGGNILVLHLGNVSTSNEALVSGTSHDDCIYIGISLQLNECIVQLLEGSGVQGIQSLRAANGNSSNMILYINQYAHISPLLL